VENHALPDPVLTELGKKQCHELMEKFPYHSDVELVVASPLRRTIYTALLGFKPVFEERKEMKLIALPEAQETSDVPCDTGSDPAVLKKEFEECSLSVDLSLLEEGWNIKVRSTPPGRV
jgi:broad specificity phosphatase PhoE